MLDYLFNAEIFFTDYEATTREKRFLSINPAACGILKLAFVVGVFGIGIGYLTQKTYKAIPLNLGNGEVVPFYQHQRMIHLKGPAFSDLYLTQLPQFPELRALRLTDCQNLTREGLEALKECPNLTFLEIEGSPAIGALGKEGIPSSLINKMSVNYKLAVERSDPFLNSDSIGIFQPKVKVFGVVHHQDDYFPFVEKISQ